MLKERIFRSFVSNLLIALVILGIFGITYFTVETPVKGSADGAINRGASSTKVAIIFSIYDGTEYVDEILQILDNQKVSASFFVAGSWVVKNDNDEMLEKISNSGNELGNNGYFKKDFSIIGSNEAKESILVTHKLVQKIAGISMKYFLPPTGTYNKDTINLVQDLGYQTIMWTKDASDWNETNPEKVFQNATKNTQAGDFVLMRPTKATVDSLDKIITHLKQNNLKPSILSQTLQAD